MRPKKCILHPIYHQFTTLTPPNYVSTHTSFEKTHEDLSQTVLLVTLTDIIAAKHQYHCHNQANKRQGFPLESQIRWCFTAFMYFHRIISVGHLRPLHECAGSVLSGACCDRLHLNMLLCKQNRNSAWMNLDSGKKGDRGTNHGG